MTAIPSDTAVPDTERRGLLRLLPAGVRPYALLARFDRPIGAWLLFWPGAWAILLAGPSAAEAVRLIVLFGIGAIAMRGAGCVYNDIVDRDLDARVARTRDRPLANGRVTLKSAWAFLIALCLIGLAVLVGLDWPARWIAVASLAPVACYPFMKRITWWPQAWLGIVFSWAALVGWAAAAGVVPAAGLLLYAGSILWVIGYDTIYALQDIEDDVLAGVKSSARAMGRHVKPGVAACYVGALLLWGGAYWLRRPDPLALLALLPMALHLIWQAATMDTTDPAGALHRFRSNRTAGLLMAMAALAVGSAG
ncbi:4-hydroxybenzoate octaprenyltransferase [Sphingomonas sp. CGMCC 1.13654]|uniref:4-hydroxybenzoate octaprenyltransferase n=1 Tax=Sphingomonas chungangi TaxID=2683589 RepID=A0A838LD51_9SPHN|nr:4-hydroxybenzoate octaprenyltransferase [Sphingomonas chungangi]MBA2936579.1 4-hydroxybenzoate octaprenyltransferase [Sphingomonas chungangi]MVW55964.1 4-hydroxybenzoate octaprenyltransferase [Sphingomonas chungangi]